MNLSIYTQNEEIVNYGEIVAISPVAGTIDVDGTSVDSFGIIATTSTGNDVQLGIFENEEAVMKVMDEIKSWLSKGVSNLFEIPASVELE